MDTENSPLKRVKDLEDQLREIRHGPGVDRRVVLKNILQEVVNKIEEEEFDDIRVKLQDGRFLTYTLTWSPSTDCSWTEEPPLHTHEWEIQ